MKSAFVTLFSASLLLAATSAAQAETTSTSLLNRSIHLIHVSNWRQAASTSRALLARPDLTTEMRFAGYANLCVAESKLDHLTDAAIACDKSIALRPDYWGGYINRGNLHVLIGDSRGAQSDYARAEALNPALEHQPALTAVTADFIALGYSAPGTQQAEVP